jgi:3-isopropylmalate dehydratase small subunit
MRKVMATIHGSCWVFGENIDTDQILPGYAMAEAEGDLRKFALAGSSIPDFASRVKPGDIVVAGANFGCGSSREQAPVALFDAGVRLVIAASFARIFRRNAINIGLPVMLANISPLVTTGDVLNVDLDTAIIRFNGRTVKGTPLSRFALATLRAGGLIARVRQDLGVA